MMGPLFNRCAVSGGLPAGRLCMQMKMSQLR